MAVNHRNNQHRERTRSAWLFDAVIVSIFVAFVLTIVFASALFLSVARAPQHAETEVMDDMIEAEVAWTVATIFDPSGWSVISSLENPPVLPHWDAVVIAVWLCGHVVLTERAAHAVWWSPEEDRLAVLYTCAPVLALCVLGVPVFLAALSLTADPALVRLAVVCVSSAGVISGRGKYLSEMAGLLWLLVICHVQDAFTWMKERTMSEPPAPSVVVRPASFGEFLAEL